ncbi:rubredoxin [Enterococcus sp. PF1-24]|uniref:rubredoxin n=1 Tax=unclassified Enterococcus TaxID=2608891 RepID=UPI0024735610|nr:MULTISPECIES: rubredoxin [unclassified Enterococcus]MDH6364903.1 rubredoxin [Enterococcus sp. PFB1-1]MDH6402004.1 rubredoxin [Enterococcus sp. PF1-24]
MSQFICKTCQFIYDEEQGDSKNGIPPKTQLKDLKNSLCHTCGMRNLQRYQVISQIRS